MPALAAPPDNGSMKASLTCAIAGAAERPAMKNRQAAIRARIRMAPPYDRSLIMGRDAGVRSPCARPVGRPMLPGRPGHFKRYNARLRLRRQSARGGDHAWSDDGCAADDLFAHPARGPLPWRRRDRLADDRRAYPPLYLSRRA